VERKRSAAGVAVDGAREDQKLAREIYGHLVGAGFSAWID
jgi:hypothetical protein